MFTRDKQGDTGKSSKGKGKGAPLFNETDGLWYRDYQFDPPYTDKVETDKPCYWSRGNGWVYTALMRVLQYAPDTVCHKDRYMEDFTAMSEALTKCQREDGLLASQPRSPVELRVYRSRRSRNLRHSTFHRRYGLRNTHGITRQHDIYTLCGKRLECPLPQSGSQQWISGLRTRDRFKTRRRATGNAHTYPRLRRFRHRMFPIGRCRSLPTG